MRNLKPVRWKEGMFLRPHHFQQMELQLAARESGRLRCLQPYDWGLVHGEIDEDALANYQLNVRSLRAVLTDGTLVDVPSNARLPSRGFESFQSQAGSDLPVALGVRTAEDGRPQTHSEPHGAGRFRSDAAEVYDLDQGQDSVPVELLSYELRLFFGEEPTAGYDVLPLCRLEKTSDPARPVRLSDQFAPPALLLAASPVLMSSVGAVVDALTTTIRKVSQDSMSEPDNLMLLHTLASSLPVVKDLVSEGQCHPRLAYRELCWLAGALYCRDPTARGLEEIPPYDHRAPAPVFDRLRRLIQEWSLKETKARYLRIEFQREADRFVAALPPEAARPGSRCVLEAAAEQSRPRLRTLMMTPRISSPERMAHLVQFARLGVGVEFMAGRPVEVTTGSEAAQYHRLKTEEEEWADHVANAEQLVVQVMNAPADLELQLIVIPPKG